MINQAKVTNPAKSIVLTSIMDADAIQHLANLESKGVEFLALSKLLKKRHSGLAAVAVNDSGIKECLTARQIHSLATSKAASWILNILEGQYVECPVPKGSGIMQTAFMKYFVKNATQIAAWIASEKEGKKKEKAAKTEPESFTAEQVSNAVEAAKAEVKKTVYAVSAADIGVSQLLFLIDALDLEDRNSLLTALAANAKYATKLATKRGNKPTTPALAS